jgi:hypothetical protein
MIISISAYFSEAIFHGKIPWKRVRKIGSWFEKTGVKETTIYFSVFFIYINLSPLFVSRRKNISLCCTKMVLGPVYTDNENSCRTERPKFAFCAASCDTARRKCLVRVNGPLGICRIVKWTVQQHWSVRAAEERSFCYLQTFIGHFFLLSLLAALPPPRKKIILLEHFRFRFGSGFRLQVDPFSGLDRADARPRFEGSGPERWINDGQKDPTVKMF